MAAVHYVLKHGIYLCGRGGEGFVAGDVLPVEDGEHLAKENPANVEIRQGEVPSAEPRNLSGDYSPRPPPAPVPESLKAIVAGILRDELKTLLPSAPGKPGKGKSSEADPGA
jgi:hypothetical protein